MTFVTDITPLWLELFDEYKIIFKALSVYTYVCNCKNNRGHTLLFFTMYIFSFKLNKLYMYYLASNISTSCFK